MALFKQELCAFTKAGVESVENEVPRYTDVLIIGGGIVGSAVAFFVKSQAPHGLDVTVVERDHCVSQGLGCVHLELKILKNLIFLFFFFIFLQKKQTLKPV